MDTERVTIILYLFLIIASIIILELASFLGERYKPYFIVLGVLVLSGSVISMLRDLANS